MSTRYLGWGRLLRQAAPVRRKNGPCGHAACDEAAPDGAASRSVSRAVACHIGLCSPIGYRDSGRTVPRPLSFARWIALAITVCTSAFKASGKSPAMRTSPALTASLTLEATTTLPTDAAAVVVFFVVFAVPFLAGARFAVAFLVA